MSATAQNAVSLPEQGQLVEVRQRRYVVGEIRQSALPPDPLAAQQLPPQQKFGSAHWKPGSPFGTRVNPHCPPTQVRTRQI